MKKMCIKYIDNEKAYEEYLNNLDEKKLRDEFANVCDILDELKYQYRYLTSYLYIEVISEAKSYDTFYKKQNIDKKSFLNGFVYHLDFVKNCAESVLNNINNIYSEFIEEYDQENLIGNILNVHKDIRVYYNRLDHLSNRMDFEIYSTKITLGEDVDSKIKEHIESYPSFVFGMEKQNDGTFNLDKRIEWFVNLHEAIEVIEDMTL